MKKCCRTSHPDEEEDPGALCALLGAMKLNNVCWGGEEDYSFSLEMRRGKVGWQGSGEEEGKEEKGANLVMCLCFPFFFFFSSVLCCLRQEWKEKEEKGGGGERRGVTVTFIVSSAIGVVVLDGPPSSLPWWDLVGVWPTW